MAHILDTIVEQKRLEVKALRESGIPAFPPPAPHRAFVAAVDRRPRLSVIAEVKRASPSAGDIVTGFDPVAIARTYESAGAAAISVLTDEKFFKGSVDCLLRVRAAVGLPVLRKDFIIDPLQVEQTAAMGADAMLLIAAILSDSQMAELFSAAVSMNIEPLIEVHDATELQRALRLSPALIGINNRNLQTFQTDLETTFSLLDCIPRRLAVVSESGIHDSEQTARLRGAGVSAVLVGESLMRAPDTAALLKDLNP